MNKKYIVLLGLLVLVLVGGIVYYSHDEEPAFQIGQIKIPGEKTSTGEKSFGQQNIDDKTIYYKISYRWYVTSESGDDRKEGDYFTVKETPATSTDVFVKDAEIIVANIIKEHGSDVGTLKPGSFEIFAIDTLVCDKSFSPQQMACYDGKSGTPQILQK